MEFLTHAYDIDKKGGLGTNGRMIAEALDLVRDEIALAEEVIRVEAHSGIDLADAAISQLASNGGKRIRPAVFLLCAKVAGGEGVPADELARIAAVIELIHTASLMHDDVIDGSRMRRGMPSTRSVWGDKASVLAGDYLWSVASKIIVGTGNGRLTEAIIDCVKRTTVGEMLELANNGNADMDEETCLRIIDGKTTSLFETAARAGAIVAGAGDAEEVALADYGRELGRAYQLMDDALDYSSNETILGKTPGSDLASGTPTYPLVAALGRACGDDLHLLRKALASPNGIGLSDVLPVIERAEGIDRTVRLATDYSEKAKERLAHLPTSPAKNSLIELADFASSRTS